MSIKDIAGAVGAALPEKMGQDMKNNVKALVRSAFEDMELVSREELDVQERVLQRTRDKLEQLEDRVRELEAQISRDATHN